MSDTTTTAAPTTPTTPATEAAPTQATTSSPEGAQADAAPMTAAEIKRWKVKIDGAESEVDEAELVRGYERAKGAHKRFEEAAKARAEVERREAELAETINLIRSGKTGPRALKRLMGDDALFAMAQDIVMERLELDAMPEPERKRRAEMSERERKIEAEERRIAEREKAIAKRHEEETAEAARAHQERFAREWPDHLKAAGIPASRAAISRMAQVLRQSLMHGADMTEREAAQAVAEEMRAEYAELAASADGPTLAKLLGSGVDKVRAMPVEAALTQPGRQAPKEQPPARRDAPASGERRAPTIEELRARYQR